MRKSGLLPPSFNEPTPISRVVVIGNIEDTTERESDVRRYPMVMRRLRYALLLAVTFGVAFVFFNATTFIDRRKYAAAVNAYVRNPMPENEVLLQSERQKTERLRLQGASISAGVVTALAAGIGAIYRSVRKRQSS
jgi:hypothetical protein